MTVMTRYDDRIRKTLQIRYIPARFFFLLAPHRLHYPLPPCFFHKSHAAFMQSHNGSSESLPRARPLCAQPSLRGSGKLFSRHSRLLCLAPIKLEKVEIGWDIGATNHLPFSPVTPGGRKFERLRRPVHQMGKPSSQQVFWHCDFFLLRSFSQFFLHFFMVFGSFL